MEAQIWAVCSWYFIILKDIESRTLSQCEMLMNCLSVCLSVILRYVKVETCEAQAVLKFAMCLRLSFSFLFSSPPACWDYGHMALYLLLSLVFFHLKQLTLILLKVCSYAVKYLKHTHVHMHKHACIHIYRKIIINLFKLSRFYQANSTIL